MKSIVLNKKKIGLILLSGFIIIQLYRPNKNSQEVTIEHDLLVSEKAPKRVREILIKSCYDCHSNYTDYNWYDNIAPISWYVDNNIKEGKNVLNFSEWKTMELIQKKIMLSAIPFDVNTGKMPKENYLLLHSKAELTQDDKERIINWISTVKENTPWDE